MNTSSHSGAPVLASRFVSVQPVQSLLLAALLVGCSGGSSQINAPVPAPVGAPVNPPSTGTVGDSALLPGGLSSGGGLWYGKLQRGDDDLHVAMCFVTATGDFACNLVDLDASPAHVDGLAAAARGTLTRNAAGQFGGSGTLLAMPGRTLADGTSVLADFTISGGALSDQNRVIELTLAGLGGPLTLDMSFDHYFYHDTTIAEVSGVFTSVVMPGSQASLEINADGQVLLQTADGCIGAGQVGVINPEHNGYTLGLTISNCAALDGDYEGWAVLTDFEWVNGTTNVLLTVFNDVHFIAAAAVK